MKFLVLSDLHANWWALQAVLKDAAGEYDQILCCGDLVGYNPRPAEVIDWTRNNCAAVIRGNHDKVVAGLEDLEWFNDVAQAAVHWTIAHLTPEKIAYLHEVPKGPVPFESFQLCHGSPRDEDEYVLNSREAGFYLQHPATPLTFFGHTHVQGGFYLVGGKVGLLPPVDKNDRGHVIELQPDAAYLINPGSVGQPRDGNPRAAYLIYNVEEKTLTFRRCEYDIEETAREIRDAGLPDVLAYRLFRGL